MGATDKSPAKPVVNFMAVIIEKRDAAILGLMHAAQYDVMPSFIWHLTTSPSYRGVTSL